MKNLFKRMLPYVIVNTIIFGIVGAIAGKSMVEIHNAKKRMGSDYEALRKFLKDMGGKATHIKIEDINEEDVPEDIREKADDPKEPMDPTVIYITD